MSCQKLPWLLIMFNRKCMWCGLLFNSKKKTPICKHSEVVSLNGRLPYGFLRFVHTSSVDQPVKQMLCSLSETGFRGLHFPQNFEWVSLFPVVTPATQHHVFLRMENLLKRLFIRSKNQHKQDLKREGKFRHSQIHSLAIFLFGT